MALDLLLPVDEDLIGMAAAAEVVVVFSGELVVGSAAAVVGWASAVVDGATGSSMEAEGLTTSVIGLTLVVEVGATTGCSVVEVVIGLAGVLVSTGAGDSDTTGDGSTGAGVSTEAEVSTGVDVGVSTGISGVITVVSVTIDEDSRVVVGSNDRVNTGVELAVTVT